MKYEWRKRDENLYLPKEKPAIINIPPMQYLIVEGEGTPGEEEFVECVQALYSLSYGIKMAPKGGITIPNYFDYTVFPLEGFWSFNEQGIKLYQEGLPVTELKQYLVFKLMIRQPDFVSNEFVEELKIKVYNKKNNKKVPTVKLEQIEEGLSCQMIHIGSYDDEPTTFKYMEEYCNDNGYKRISKDHKEIYISDPSRVDVSKLKTTVRFKIEQI